MGAEQGRRRRTLRTGTYIGCAALLLAGCASMPDSGDLRDVDASQRPDPQVRVVAVPPRENATPAEIVTGFLEALVSDEPKYDTARKYLTGQESSGWRPDQSVTVLADGPTTVPQQMGARDSDNEYAFDLRGTKVAAVDGQDAYAPDDGNYSQTVHLSRQGVPGMNGKQWRIDAVPQGVVMGKSDFQRIYVSVDKYYFASDGGDPSGRPSAVADPVYVRDQVDPLTEIVRSLMEGPSRWLGQVVRSSFPTGTALKHGVTALAPDDQGKLKVPLNSRADRVGSTQCDEMAAQLLFTLQDLTPTGVGEVELQRSNGTQLCVLKEDKAQVFASHGTTKGPEYQYFVDAKGRLVRVPGTSTQMAPEPVPGALGEGTEPLRSAAVSRDEDKAAGVSADGRDLYVGSLVSGGSVGSALLHSTSATAKKDGLTTPSWDSRGDLWVADRDPERSRLLVLEQGAGQPLTVRTPGLEGRIEAVRVAADGVRVALIVNNAGDTSLQIGRIERQTVKATEPPVISVYELRPAAPQLDEVTAMSWAGDSRLVVVGRERGGVQQMRYVQCDGSTPEAQPPAALTGVEEIAASENERLPLLAHSEDGIVRLSGGAQWQKVVEGTAPVYPG